MSEKTTARIWMFRGRGLVPTLIRVQSRGRWNHAAIELGGDVYEAREWRRVMVRPARVVLGDAIEKRGDVMAFGLELTEGQLEEMRIWLRDQIGKRYDWSSVFRFVTRRQARRKSAEVWFCSELAFAACKTVGIDLLARTEPWEVSPALLARSPLLKDGVSLTEPR